MHRQTVVSDCSDFGECNFRVRQDSDASTALPASPLLSRMVSPADDVFDGITENSLAEFELNGLEDEISTAALSANEPAHIAQPTKSFEQAPTLLQSGYLVFLPVVAGVIMYGSLISSTCCIFMAAIAVLMVLPGIYLWVVDGSRPEDYEAKKNREQNTGNLAVYRILFLGLGAVLAMPISSSVLMFMGAVAMLLPGIYLWKVDGCRPEDYEEDCQARDEDSSCDVMFARLGLGIMFGMWFSKSFRIFQGIAAVVMLLPGLYLWTVEGCRPEDYEENCRQEKAGHLAVLKISLPVVGTMLFMPMSASVLIILGIIAALMLLPGIYLWAVDGCRPEDYEDACEEEQEEGSSDIMFARLVLGSMIGMWFSKGFRIFQGIVAMLVVMPGMYLWVADGCRPEDYDENCRQNRDGDLAMFKLVLLSLGIVLSVWISTCILIFVVVMAALTLLPGMYLWVFDGCRPEDYMAYEQIKQE